MTPRRLAALGFGLATLALVELGLRIFGVAPPNRPIRMTFLRPGPFFIREGESYRTNPRRGYTWSDTFPAKKDAKRLRIFIAGGSTARGFPFEKTYDSVRLVKLALESLGAAEKSEVVRASALAYASYDVKDVVEEVLAYEPDAVVVITGHNEFLEKRFPAAEDDAFKRALSSLRIYRLLKGAVQKARGELGRGKHDLHLVSSKERELVLRDFRESLRQMARLCREKGVPLVLVTCASNLKDFRPYGTSNVPLVEQEEIDQRIRASDTKGAMAMLEEWRKRFPSDAWIHFEKGWALFMMARAAVTQEQREKYLGEALEHWTRARDRDPIPIRASTTLNAIIREVGGSDGVTLADFEAELAALANPPGIMGRGFFLDHCHPDRTAQPMLAGSIISALASAGVIELAPGWEQAADLVWQELYESVPAKKWADSYCRVAVESGINVHRVHRGLEHANRCLKLDPRHPEVREIMAELAPLAQGSYQLIGD